MSTFTEHDQASGDDLDRRSKGRYLCATCGDTGMVSVGTSASPILTSRPCPACDRGKTCSSYLDRHTRSKEAVALDLAVDALATARTALLHAPTGRIPAIEKIARALFGIAELRK